jgi:hypothetical protein
MTDVAGALGVHHVRSDEASAYDGTSKITGVGALEVAGSVEVHVFDSGVLLWRDVREEMADRETP